MLWTKSSFFFLLVFLGFFLHSRASNSKVHSAILPEYELIRDFMPVPVICNFHEDPIKTNQAMLGTRLNMGFFGIKGQVTPESMVRSGRNLNLFEILCLSMLSASFN